MTVERCFAEISKGRDQRTTAVGSEVIFDPPVQVIRQVPKFEGHPFGDERFKDFFGKQMPPAERFDRAGPQIRSCLDVGVAILNLVSGHGRFKPSIRGAVRPAADQDDRCWVHEPPLIEEA